MLAVLVVLVTALDRVLLGVHYPSDVTVGVLTGVGLVLASYAGYVGWNPPDPTEVDDPDVDPTHPPGDLMPFLTRWDDDHSRPKFTSALRDVVVRAVLPAVALFGVIVGFGFLLKGPLYSFSKWENGINRWFQDGRTETGETITKFMSMIGNTEYVIAVGVIVCAIVWWRTKEWWFAVVPLIAISLQATVFVIATTVVGRDAAHRRAARPHPADVELPQRARRCLDRALRLVRPDGDPHLQRRRAPGGHRAVHRGAAARVVRPALPRRAPRVRHRVGILNGVVCALLAWNYLRREPASGTSSSARSRGASRPTRPLRPARSASGRTSTRRRPRCPRPRG